MPDYRRLAREHAERLVVGFDDGFRSALATEPFPTVESVDGLTVRTREESDGPGGTCPVDGSYHAGTRTITVARSRSTRRRNFTLLHEFGHDVVYFDGDCNDVLARQPDNGHALEEEIVSAVAAELLLPNTVVDAHIPIAGPTARSVAELFDGSQASREACCVRAAQRITSTGYVILAESSVARFSATAGTPFGIARGVDQGAEHLIAQAAKVGSARGETRIRFASGWTSDPYHGDAVATDNRYVFCVLVSDRPPWGGLSVLADRGGAEAFEGECLWCGESFESWESRCRHCGSPSCPACGRCSCEPTTNAERLCDECFLRKPPHQFTHSATTCDDHFDD